MSDHFAFPLLGLVVVAVSGKVCVLTDTGKEDWRIYVLEGTLCLEIIPWVDFFLHLPIKQLFLLFSVVGCELNRVFLQGKVFCSPHGS